MLINHNELTCCLISLQKCVKTLPWDIFYRLFMNLLYILSRLCLTAVTYIKKFLSIYFRILIPFRDCYLLTLSYINCIINATIQTKIRYIQCYHIGLLEKFR